MWLVVARMGGGGLVAVAGIVRLGLGFSYGLERVKGGGNFGIM